MKFKSTSIKPKRSFAGNGGLSGILQKTFTIAAETLVVVLLIYVPTVAQTQTPAPSKVFEGLLVKVNPDTKTFSVRPTVGEEVEFAYTDDTEILNADRKREGLADKTGTQVKVTYTDHAGIYTATKIEMLDKQPE